MPTKMKAIAKKSSAGNKIKAAANEPKTRAIAGNDFVKKLREYSNVEGITYQKPSDAGVHYNIFYKQYNTGRNTPCCLKAPNRHEWGWRIWVRAFRDRTPVPRELTQR